MMKIIRHFFNSTIAFLPPPSEFWCHHHEAFSAIYGPQEMAFSSCGRKLTSFGS